MPDKPPMENPPPLAGLDPADLLRQGVADDTFVDGAPAAFVPPALEGLAKIFPQFEILELIGQGGMGAVYKVRQKDLDRIVALKILPPGIGQSPEFSNRFTREARALAKLNHPGIVTLHEFGQHDGLYFILMEFVDGVNLAQLMKTGRISPREALAIVPQIRYGNTSVSPKHWALAGISSPSNLRTLPNRTTKNNKYEKSDYSLGYASFPTVWCR
jgi:serine/threonine protein kinase